MLLFSGLASSILLLVGFVIAGLIVMTLGVFFCLVKLTTWQVKGNTPFHHPNAVSFSNGWSDSYSVSSQSTKCRFAGNIS